VPPAVSRIDVSGVVDVIVLGRIFPTIQTKQIAGGVVRFGNDGKYREIRALGAIGVSWHEGKRRAAGQSIESSSVRAFDRCFPRLRVVEKGVAYSGG
jgi:hypothetical protein